MPGPLLVGETWARGADSVSTVGGEPVLLWVPCVGSVLVWLSAVRSGRV